MVFDPRKCAEASNQFAQQSLRMEIVANRRDRHQTPPGESCLHSHSLIFFYIFVQSPNLYFLFFLTSYTKLLRSFGYLFIFSFLFFKYLFVDQPECFNEGPGVTRVVHHVHFLVGEVANPAGAVQIVLSFFYTCHLSF